MWTRFDPQLPDQSPQTWRSGRDHRQVTKAIAGNRRHRFAVAMIFRPAGRDRR
jgi:hypothetical protein